jgi:putative addiction module killer protein
VIPQERQLKKLETSEGNIPFDDWYNGLKDKKVRAIIAARLLRIQTGNFGDVKSLDSGVFEFRIHVGSGYRIYFAEANDILIILLCGGDKRSQNRDIKTAITLWNQYRHDIERYLRDF